MSSRGEFESLCSHLCYKSVIRLRAVQVRDLLVPSDMSGGQTRCKISV